MTVPALVCVVPICENPPDAGTLCRRHADLAARPLPRRLVKQPRWFTDENETGQLNDEEMRAIAAQVQLDALPLFVAALEWCAWQALAAS